jgi:hypothetical protein
MPKTAARGQHSSVRDPYLRSYKHVSICLQDLCVSSLKQPRS